MWYHTVPLLFVALQEYKPKSFTVLGANVNVLTSCVELTPSNITRPFLNQVILARGFARTAHFMVVTWPIHDLTTAFEEALLLKWGLSNIGKTKSGISREELLTCLIWLHIKATPVFITAPITGKTLQNKSNMCIDIKAGLNQLGMFARLSVTTFETYESDALVSYSFYQLGNWSVAHKVSDWLTSCEIETCNIGERHEEKFNKAN